MKKQIWHQPTLNDDIFGEVVPNIHQPKNTKTLQAMLMPARHFQPFTLILQF